jgi:2Fe-2S ferredoxin
MLARCGGRGHAQDRVRRADGTEHGITVDVDRSAMRAAAMIECALHIRPNSRLSCQTVMTQEFDGLVLQLPESQV